MEILCLAFWSFADYHNGEVSAPRAIEFGEEDALPHPKMEASSGNRKSMGATQEG
ncbi:unnamed protein product [marine sediment metagenome]|uniref:Uncharacterized protein n=1 Tax=marine sediment metagenome TaxID=412755 RepID=X1AFZ8_9ZZZZ